MITQHETTNFSFPTSITQAVISTHEKSSHILIIAAQSYHRQLTSGLEHRKPPHTSVCSCSYNGTIPGMIVHKRNC